MADRLEALTACLNAARAWRGSRGYPFEPQAAAALCAAIDAVDAVGDEAVAVGDAVVLHRCRRATGTCAAAWAGGQCQDCHAYVPPGDDTVTTTALFWCAAPECWRQNDTAGMYCHQHSPAASLPQVRRRDAVFGGGDDGP